MKFSGFTMRCKKLREIEIPAEPACFKMYSFHEKNIESWNVEHTLKTQVHRKLNI